MGPAQRRTWFDALPAHPIFGQDASDGAGQDARAQLLAMRGTDLIAVVQNEVRITSLAQAKRALSDERGEALAYKVLTDPLLDFTICQVLVNPTGKLLAVVGKYSIVLFALPRRGYMKQVGARVRTKAVRIGAYYHDSHGCGPIAQCAWHLLGREGASLVVLTEDAILREYDVGRDADEPQQTIACLPSASALHTRAMFSADDDDGACAVAFAFGNDDAASWTMRDADSSTDGSASPMPSWALLSVFVLMRNGDVWCICPFMPKYASMPRVFVESLAACEAQDGAETCPMRARYLHDLCRQFSHATEAAELSTTTGDVSFASCPEHAAMLDVVSPASVAHRVMPQGPFLLRPAPVELNDDVAPVASGLFFAQIRAQAASTAPLDICGIAFCDGSIQLCILAEPTVPRWATQTAAEPPTLVVYESIDLGLDKHCAYTQLQEANATVFVKDPLYPDTVFVTHAFGVHLIDMRPWTVALLDAVGNDAPDAVSRVIADAKKSVVVPLVEAQDAHGFAQVVGAVLINDVYLSYSFLALTAAAQLVAVELGLRVDTQADVCAPTDALYTSLLAETPFAPPRAFAAPLRRVDAPRETICATPSALRTFGKCAEQARTNMRDVVNAANEVQSRVALQMREMQRQVAQLDNIVYRVQALGSGDVNPLHARVERIQEGQRATMRRLDTLLQQLMDEHQPQLSIYERRWFDELQRMASEFGVGDTKRAAAHEQLKKLEHQLHVLRPSFAVLAAERAHTLPADQRLGTQQLQRVETLLVHESTVLAQARAKIQRLQQAVGR
ncbi:hypothetical protein MVES1_001181 [Malassezia vespertilionis]|uniref:Nup82p n=1 Tax=Malassezia vespertilionis TaxID=2020962 RepID=A0A2N1JF89_9BASI|nr:uncharacterized protein MVES1_001181 [Malassezia vespertilionis]PKI85212.1 hypothetical protein MVES_001115 [Malassezia vespertilionis]WFD05847.1 hypothetical protein MVES1_001181 [Malassezia vespertilionis]